MMWTTLAEFPGIHYQVFWGFNKTLTLVSWHLTSNPLPTLYWPPTDLYWPFTDPLLTLHWPPTDPLLTPYWPFTDPLLTLYWPPTDPLLTPYWPFTDPLLTLYWPPTDSPTDPHTLTFNAGCNSWINKVSLIVQWKSVLLDANVPKPWWFLHVNWPKISPFEIMILEPFGPSVIAFKIIFSFWNPFFLFSCSYHCHHALYRNTWQKENHGSTILFNCSVLLSSFHLFRKVRHRISSFLLTTVTALLNDIQDKSIVTRIILDDDRLSWMKQIKKNSYCKLLTKCLF